MHDYRYIPELRKTSVNFKNTYKNEIPLFKTWLKNYPYSNLSYNLSEDNNKNVIESIRTLTERHPKLIYPLIASVSTAFCPFDNKAIFQFSTNSVSAKNLINLLVSILYSKAYIYNDKYALDANITQTFEYENDDCRNCFVIHQLDKFDISKVKNLFGFFYAYSLDQYNDILYACSDCRSYPIDQHKSSILFTLSGLLTNQYSCGHCSFYEKILLVNTTYGEEKELQRSFQKLCLTLILNNSGCILSKKKCWDLKRADVKLRNPIFKNLEKYLYDADLQEYSNLYIKPMISAAKVLESVFEITINWTEFEGFLLNCYLFYINKRDEFQYYYTDFVYHCLHNRPAETEITEFSRPSNLTAQWLTHEIVLTESIFNETISKVMHKKRSESSVPPSDISIVEIKKQWQEMNLLKQTEDGIITISVFDTDVTVV